MPPVNRESRSAERYLGPFRWQSVALVAILVLAGGLRLLYLGNESLWQDEGYSVMASAHFHNVFKYAIKDVHPPLFYLLLYGWRKLFGSSEFALRLLPALFGWLAVWMIYRVGRRLFDEEVGLVGALLLAVSPFHIFYSQELRSYSLLTLLTLASVLFFVITLREPSLRAKAGYVSSSILLMYTHVFGLFVILAQNLYAAVMMMKRSAAFPWRSHLRLQIWLVALFLPWAEVLRYQTARVLDSYWIPRPSLDTFGQALVTYAGSPYLLWIFLTLVLVAASRPLWRRPEPAAAGPGHGREDYPLVLLAAWLATSTVVPFALSLVSRPVFITRVTIAASLAFYLLASRGLSLLRPRGLKLATLGVLIAGSVALLPAYYTRAGEEDWRAAAGFVESRARSGDFVICDHGRGAFDYYARRSDLPRQKFRPGAGPITDSTAPELLPSVAGAERFWLVLCSRPDPDGCLKRLLEQRFDLKEDRQFTGLQTYLYQRRSVNKASGQDGTPLAAGPPSGT